MPELPPISEDFTANVTGYLAAIQSMIDRTQELVDKVEELQDLIDGLDGKIINIDVGGNALEQIGIIENRLEGLENRTIQVNVIYRQLNEPGGVPVTSPVVGAPSGTSGAVGADSALAAAIQAVTDKMNAENLTAAQSAAILSKLGYAQQASAGAARNAAAAENAETASLKDLEAAVSGTSSRFEELSARGQFLRGVISQNEAYTKLLTDAYTTLALRVSPNIELTNLFAAKLAAAGGDATAFRKAIAEGDPILLAFANGAKAAGDNVGGILIPLTAASFGITGIATALHLAVMGTFEFLAVFIPAMYAAAAGAAVMMQGVQIVTHGVSALYTSAEALGPMFNTTAGDMLGLGHTLQTAQNLANPAVYTLLGEAILGIKAATDIVSPGMSSFGTLGLNVAHMLDQFGARLVVDIQDNMPKIRQLVSGASTDLQMFGQILGNIGHALVNFAAAMPGLAVVLLHIVDGFTALIKWVSALPAPLLTVIMVIEEMYRWSGVLVGVFGMVGRAIGLLGTLGIPVFAKIGANVAAMGANILMGTAAMITNFAAMASKISGGEGAVKIDSAVARVAKGFAGLANFMTGPWGAAIGIGILAVGALVFALSRVTTSTENFINASQKIVQQASNLQVLNVIAQQFQATSTAAVAAQANIGKVANSMTMMSARSGETGIAMEQARQSVTQLTQAQQQLLQQNLNVAQGAAYISKTYKVDFTAALAMADMAGVKLANGILGTGEAARKARIQIDGLYLGYARMDQTGSTLTNTMNAISIQAGLQATKVSQVNQAWDQFIGMSTSLTGSFSQFNLDLQQMGNAANVTGAKINAFTGTTTLSITQIASELKYFSGDSSQMWLSFNQSVQQANTFMDSLRIAAAAGTVTQTQYGDAAKYVTAQLMPYAQQSKAALAEVMAIAQESAGPAYDGTKSLADNYKILANWTDQTKNSSKNFAGELTDLTIGISNVTTVARNFAGTLQSDVLNAVAAAGADTTKITALTEAYTASLAKNGLQSPVTKKAQDALTAALAAYGIKGQAVTQVEQILSNSYANNTNTINAGNAARATLQNDISKLISTVPSAGQDIVNLASAVRNHGTTAQQLAGARQTLINDLIRSGVEANTAKNDVNNLITALRNIPANVSATVTVTGRGGESIVSSVGPGGTVTVYPVRAAAEGGVLPGYSPGHDSIHALLSPGEGVLIPQAVKALGGERGINQINKQAQHFAWGGVTGLPSQMDNTAATDFGAANAAVLAKSLSTINSQIAAKLAAAAAAAAAAGSAVSYNKIAGVTQWEGDVLKVLGMLGLPASDLSIVMSQMITESGGNPNAINLTDINARNGTPSKGLMQVIGPTFAKYRSSSLSSNIYDPLANIYAGLNYAIHAYPGYWTQVLGHGHGYDNGGWLMPGLTMAYNGTGKPERVSPPGGGGEASIIHNVINMDGKTIYEATLPYAYQKSGRNNGNSRAGNYWTPGSR